MFWLLVNLVVGAVGFPADETITGYATRGAVYELVELDGAPVNAAAAIRFDGRKVIHARSPCFAYTGRQVLPMPWFSFQETGRTAYSCIELPFEDQFFIALTHSELAEVAGDTVILSDDSGPRLVFKRARY